MDVEFADPTYTVKELKAKIARIGLKLPARRIQTMFGSRMFAAESPRRRIIDSPRDDGVVGARSRRRSK